MIAKQAVGDISLDDATYLAGANRGGEAMPLGFRDGGIRVKHNFSADGEYRFQIHFPDRTLGLYTANLENEATVVLLIDGKVVFKKAIGGVDDLMLNNRKAGDGRAQIQARFDKIPIQVQAGIREVVVGFVERSRFESTSYLAGGGLGGGAVFAGSGGLQPDLRQWTPTPFVQIKGPYNPTGCFHAESLLDLRLRSPRKQAKRLARSRSRKTWRAALSAGRRRKPIWPP